MSRPAWLDLRRALVDTGVFILWYRSDPQAQLFFRNPNIEIYDSKVTRKELLRPPINAAERRSIVRMLAPLRLINPQGAVASAYDDLLKRYSYLHYHLADAIIAASAVAKNLPVVTTNVRHFKPIEEIEVFAL